MLTSEQEILLSAMLGKKASKTIADLAILRDAVGQALSIEDQLFVSANWREFADFVRTDAGKIAVQTLVQDWKESTGVKA